MSRPPEAQLLIKPLPHYRRDAFSEGLEACGLRVMRRIERPGPGDVLCAWNLTGSAELEADRFRRAGAKVIVTENGYLEPADGSRRYAVALDGHNGAGRFPVGEGDRWAALGVQVKPWRANPDGHLLVCAQRGIGARAMASPHGWHLKIAQRLHGFARHKVRVRAHPGDRAARPTLAQDLEGAFACIVWASAAGVQALIEGIPVYYCAPHWICSSAATRGISTPLFGDAVRDDVRRLDALQRLAWGQWSPDEIATGTPLQGVLAC